MKRKHQSVISTRQENSGSSSDVVITAFDRLNTADRVPLENTWDESPQVSHFDPVAMVHSPTPLLSAPPKNLKLWSLEPRRSKVDLLKDDEQQDLFVSSLEEEKSIQSPKPCTPGSYCNFPSPPTKSCTANDQIYQSPYWSNPVSMNPFSPIPAEHLSDLVVLDGTRNDNCPLSPRTPPRGSKNHIDCILTPSVLKNGTNKQATPWTDAQGNTMNEKEQYCHSYNQNQPYLTRNFMEGTSFTSQSRFNSDFQCLRVLGKGSFGIVYKVLSRLDGCLYAVKMAKSSVKGEAIRSGTLREVHALSSLSNRSDIGSLYIVRYHQAWIEDSTLFFQTELCETSLREELQKQNQGNPHVIIKESRICKVFHDVSLALDFIHRQGIVHLDIKPENIFFKDEKYKLGDFGLASKAGGRAADEGDSRYLPLEMLSDDANIDLTKVSIMGRYSCTQYAIN